MIPSYHIPHKMISDLSHLEENLKKKTPVTVGILTKRSISLIALSFS